jgi:hypothetical protein
VIVFIVQEVLAIELQLALCLQFLVFFVIGQF